MACNISTPQGKWKMTGDFLDSSGNGNDLTASGGTTFGNDKNSVANQAASFDDVNDQLETPSLDLGSTWSIVMWVFMTAGGGNTALENSNSGDLIRMGYQIVTSAKFEAQVDLSGASAKLIEAVALATNTWTMYTLTCDGTNARLYKNKVLEDTQATTNGAAFGSTVHRIGRDKTGGNGWPGRMDEIQFFNGKVLNQEEIDALVDTYDVQACPSADTSALFFGSGF